ncbi:MAG: AMP-binding protein, partial [Actinomycetota bacterium]|nr:AMP-binding protein [Actinomycetota bacterium]
DPDVIAGAPASGGRDSEYLVERQTGSRHDLHPDLALLMSTSGSTGSPKLVRLSADNVQANAEAIASYLGIEESDRAPTTLPIHYCYGLSVVNSHLLRGAGLVLTDLSVVEATFWERFRESGATSIAGVPYTFDLLDGVGFDDMDLPTLRRVTQAGGRLRPERVQHYARLGRRRGWDFFVMYGQTEATARMAYLSPDLADRHPTTIGRPVEGGSFMLDPVQGQSDTDVGELVYTGPNVMLGYAERPEDLAAGRTVDRLRTGDLGRRTDAGLYEVIGRRSRFLKIFGLRIDLDQVERLLGERGLPAVCTGDDDRIVAALERRYAEPSTESDIVGLVGSRVGLPPDRVAVLLVDELPRLESGKTDHGALRSVALSAPAEDHGAVPGARRPATVRDLYAQLLGGPAPGRQSTFVSLGGDSLSYVEISVRLEEMLGQLPVDWHTMPVRELEEIRALAPPPQVSRWRWQRLEMTVVLRAVAIVLVVGSHSNVFMLAGGAHVLLAVAGFNFARFSLAHPRRRDRLSHLRTSICRIIVPSVVWLALVVALTDSYGLTNVFLMNTVLRPDGWTDAWHYWYVESLVLILVALAALMAIPQLHRWERASPFWFVAVPVVAALVLRFELVTPGSSPDRIHSPQYVFWAFALGWAAAQAATWQHRLVVSMVILVSTPGFFDDPSREAVVVVGLLLLVWRSRVTVPSALVRPLAVLASASLFIYLTHWQVYPHLEFVWPLGALLASLTVGVVVWALAQRVGLCAALFHRPDTRRRTAAAG